MFVRQLLKDACLAFSNQAVLRLNTAAAQSMPHCVTAALSDRCMAHLNLSSCNAIKMLKQPGNEADMCASCHKYRRKASCSLLVAALEVAAAEDAPKPPKDANAGVDCADAVAVDCPKGIVG